MEGFMLRKCTDEDISDEKCEKCEKVIDFFMKTMIII